MEKPPVTFTLKGTDHYGETIEETITIPAVTWKGRSRAFLLRILPYKMALWFGLTKFRYISGIKDLE